MTYEEYKLQEGEEFIFIPGILLAWHKYTDRGSNMIFETIQLGAIQVLK